MIRKKERKGHFTFNKAEIIIYSIFVIANAGLAFFQVMPEQVSKYPPSEKDLKSSFLMGVLGRRRDAHDDQW
jgi:hypothetical protein